MSAESEGAKPTEKTENSSSINANLNKENQEQSPIKPIPEIKIKERPENKGHSDQDDKKRREKWVKSTKKFFKGFFRLVEICALVAAVITAWVIYDQLQEMRGERNLDERAWVLPTGDVSETDSGNKDSGVFSITYKNTGKTPALNMQCVISCATEHSQIPKEDGYPNLHEHEGLCAPEGIGYLATPVIPKQCFIDISTGKPFFIYGTIWYDDIFGGHHWSQFCFEAFRGVFNKDLIYFFPMQIHDSCDDVQASQGK